MAKASQKGPVPPAASPSGKPHLRLDRVVADIAPSSSLEPEARQPAAPPARTLGEVGGEDEPRGGASVNGPASPQSPVSKVLPSTRKTRWLSASIGSSSRVW